MRKIDDIFMIKYRNEHYFLILNTFMKMKSALKY